MLEEEYLINVELLKKVSDLLINKKFTIGTAESCTGGLLANILTNISGSSNYFKQGVITYSNDSKKDLLDVPVELLINHGAVSEQVARSMADNMRIKSNVDIAISITGIAGPTGGTSEKPVGLVYIAVSTKDLTRVEKNIFDGDRKKIKENSCNEALNLVYDVLR